MAIYGPSDRAATSEGGGGGIHYDPNDISNARPVYDPMTGQIEFRMPDGTRLGGSGQGQNGNSSYGPYAGAYQNDPSQMPPASLQNNETFFGPGGAGASSAPGGGGGGGGVPLALKKLAAGAVPAIAGRVASGGGGSQLTPELQQLLALAMKRMQDQEPLFQAINRQAMAGLPASYQR